MHMTSHEHYLDHTNEYDQTLPCIIPHVDLFFSTCLSFIPGTASTILELGSGTGYATSLLLRKNPGFQITCMDKSPRMLDLARQKPELNPCRFIEGDITEDLPEERFDCIISTLTLHHLPDTARFALIKHVLERLNPSGVFICGDVFRPDEEWIEILFRNRWQEHMVRSGMSPDRVRQTLQGRERSWPMIDTTKGFLGKMRDAGFVRVIMPYQYDMFGVSVGLAPR